MESRNCPDCGAVLSAAALEGMCPSCLAGLLGFDDRSAEFPAERAPGAGPVFSATGTDETKAPLPAADTLWPGAKPSPKPLTPPPVVATPNALQGGFKAPPQRIVAGAVHGQLLNVLLDVPGHVVTAEIARGGMGIVYRATQLDPRREVALKMLLSSQVGIQHLRDHFLLEARAIARLDHPNILPIYHLGEHEGIPFFTMKLATHGSLHHRRARYRNQWALIAEHIATLADAVSYAHQHGVLHRDLKPGNVLFDESNRPYVTDFGLARVIESGAQVVSEGTHLVGTPRYMAPEVIEGGADAATTASDVYALGLIFYELIAQRGPYEAGNEHEHMRRVLNEPIPRPSTFVSGVPVDLELLCLRCLEHDRQQRLSSAAVLRDELRLWMAGKPLHLRKLSWWDRWRVWARRHQILTASVVVGLVAAAVATVAAVIAIVGLLRFKQDQIQSRESNTENLAASRVGEAQRLRFEGRLGQKTAILNLLREAGVASSTTGLRSEAVRQVTQPNVGEELARYSLGMIVDRVETTADFDLLALASPSGELRVWRRSTAKVLWQQQLTSAHPPAVLEFSPGGQWLAVGSETNTVSLYEAANGNLLRTLAGTWVGFLPEDHDLALWQGDSLTYSAIRTGESKGILKIPVALGGVSGIPRLNQARGKSGVIVPRRDGLDLLAANGAVVQRLPWAGDPPTALLWFDEIVVAGDATGVLHVWSLPELTPRVLAGHSGSVRRLLLEPECRRLWSTAGRGEAFWWELRTGSLLGRAPNWQPIRPSLDGQQLLVMEDDVASVLPVMREAGRRQLELSSAEPVRFIEFATGDFRMVTVQPHSLALWDVATGRHLTSIASQGAESAHYNASGTRLALIEATQVRWLQVVALTNGVGLKEFQPPLALGPGRRRPGQVTPRRGTVLLIDARGDLLSLNVEHGEATKLLSNLRPDLLVTGDERNETLGFSGPAYGISAFVRPSGRRLFNRADRWGTLILSPDGQSFLQPGPGEHRLLEVSTGRVKWIAPAEPGAMGSGLGAWPADGHYVVAAAQDGAIRLLQPDTGYGIFDLFPPAPLTSLTVTADGKQIAAGTANGTVTLWNIPALETALKAAGVGLPVSPTAAR